MNLETKITIYKFTPQVFNIDPSKRVNVLTDLQNRGVEDILIACIDDLKGFPEAIQSVYPNTAVQLCVVHQIRNSIKHVGSKNQKEFLKDLKCVYQAVNKESAEKELLKLEEKWGEQYPIVIRSWQENWDKLSEYFQYTPAIRKLIYTTNTVEGYHRQICKVTKNKGVFPPDTPLENRSTLLATIYGRHGPCYWLIGEPLHDNR